MVSFVYSQSVPDEKILEMKTAFAKYDADGSGMLSNDEFRRIAPDMGVRHNPKRLPVLQLCFTRLLSSPSFSQA